MELLESKIRERKSPRKSPRSASNPINTCWERYFDTMFGGQAASLSCRHRRPLPLYAHIPRMWLFLAALRVAIIQAVLFAIQSLVVFVNFDGFLETSQNGCSASCVGIGFGAKSRNHYPGVVILTTPNPNPAKSSHEPHPKSEPR